MFAKRDRHDNYPGSSSTTFFMPSDDQLDIIYDKFLDASFCFDNGIAPPARITQSQDQFLFYLIQYGNPAQVAAFKKKHGLDIKNPQFPVWAVMGRNALCLDYLGSLGADLSKGTPGPVNEEGLPPPARLAIREADLKSLEVLAKYNAIVETGAYELSRGIVGLIASLSGRNGQAACAAFEYVKNHLEADESAEKVKKEILPLAAQSRDYFWYMRNLFKYNEAKLLQCVLEFGLDPIAGCGESAGARVAAKHGSLECLQELIINGYDVTACDSFCAAFVEPVKECLITCFPIVVLVSPCLAINALYSSGTALQAAEKHNQMQCKQLILDWSSHLSSLHEPTKDQRERFVFDWKQQNSVQQYEMQIR